MECHEISHYFFHYHCGIGCCLLCNEVAANSDQPTTILTKAVIVSIVRFSGHLYRILYHGIYYWQNIPGRAGKKITPYFYGNLDLADRMKLILFFCFAFFFTKVDAQDSARIKEIDALVADIKVLPYKEVYDSIVNDMPSVGMKSTMYVRVMINDGQLFRYSYKVNASNTIEGFLTKMNSESTFYYNKNKLIKVEEFLLEGEKKGKAEWYYADGAPLHYTLQTEMADFRAKLLLDMGNNFLKSVIK